MTAASRARAAGVLLARAASAGRSADAYDRWVAPGLAVAAVHRIREAWWRFLASALGYRAAAPSGLEAPAALVLSSVSLIQCATGHQWPASVAVEIDGARVDLCAECALAVGDAGLTGRGER